MAYVKCPVCGQTFNREKEPFIKTNNGRYAHEACGKVLEKELKDKRMLEDYIKQIYRIERLSPLMWKQIKRFHDELGFTYSGMAGTLVYFYNIQGHSTEKAKGVGILEYTYQEAKEYYGKLAKVNKANEGQDFSIQSRTISIPIPQAQKKRQRFFRLFEGDD